MEQAAFDPGHFVPGVGPSPDKMLQGRLFAYGDAHRYRLGINHTRIPVNSPKGVPRRRRPTTGVTARCGSTRTVDAAKNYEPNSFDGPRQSDEALYRGFATAGISGSTQPERHDEDDDFTQAGDLYRLMSADEKERLVGNIAASLAQVSRDDIIERAIGHFGEADPDYGRRVEAEVKARRS